MNAADTSASSAIAPCTPLTSVLRSSTTLAIDTFMSDVSTTSTNIAIASRTASRRLLADHSGSSVAAACKKALRRIISGGRDVRHASRSRPLADLRPAGYCRLMTLPEEARARIRQRLDDLYQRHRDIEAHAA